MGGLIIRGVIILAVLGLIGYVTIRIIKNRYRQDDKIAGRPVKGDLTARQEQVLINENDQIARLVRDLLSPPSGSALEQEFVILPDGTRTSFGNWLKQHDSRKKEQR